MKIRLFLLMLCVSARSLAAIPATEVMTLYEFNGKLDIPYYEIDSFVKPGKPRPAGTLAQGTALIPCLAMRNGKPVTNRKGTPFVGFEVVMDSRNATTNSVADFKRAIAKRRAMMVRNHHCGADVRYVIDVRKLYVKTAGPLLAPPPVSATAANKRPGHGELDDIIRAFHNSAQCGRVNQRITGRRDALHQAWNSFVDASKGRWPGSAMKRARHLDYVLRTAIFEGHLDRGCNAYGACERNTIALSIRNRARGSCLKRQGCGFPGDFKGAASAVSQYNIWDEYLTQISGLTSCFLRDDMSSGRTAADGDYYRKLQRMYAQSLPDIQRILFGGDNDLKAIFPGVSLADAKRLRHYYHPPAMGKCFPEHDRIEYMSGAVAANGDDYALIANTRIKVDRATGRGYFFRSFEVKLQDDRDIVKLVDDYPGFVVDGRKVDLKRQTRCAPYGIPKGCRMESIGRYRKTPSWLRAGKALALTCSVRDRGEQCGSPAVTRTVEVGGVCDIEMRPVSGVK